MVNTVIGELYNSFSKEQLKALDQYIQTSNWQYSETIVNCHTCFRDYSSQGKLAELNKEIIFQYVYGEDDLNDSKLRFLLNRMVDAIRECVLLYEDRSGNIYTDKVWMDYLLELRVKKNIQYNLDKKSRPSSVENKFLQQFFRSQESNKNILHFNKDIKEHFKSYTALMRDAELFSDFIFIQNYVSLISFTNVYQSMPVELPAAKLEEIKLKHWDKDYPEFLIYQNLLDLLINKNDGNLYKRYKENLFKHLDIWNQEEKSLFLISLLNFTTGQINSGKLDYIDEQYHLFELFEERQLFEIPKFINSNRINNVVSIYLRKKQYDKATNFVQKYIAQLPNENQDSCLHFNLARIHFEKLNYKQSLRELLRVDFSQDHGYSLNSKLLLLKNYYELRESDAFDSLCSSFKEFVRKNKIISDTNKLFLINFIKMTKRLYEASDNKRKKMVKELESATQIAEKAWLLEKCNLVK